MLCSLGWISVEKPAARGRVAQHRIELSAILKETMPHWHAVGPEFEERMSSTPTHPVDVTNVVPLRANSVTVPAQDGIIRPAVAEQFLAQDPAICAEWFTDLTVVDVEGWHSGAYRPKQICRELRRNPFSDTPSYSENYAGSVFA